MKTLSILRKTAQLALVSAIFATQALAAPVLTAQSFNVNENTANDTLIGKVTASGGDAAQVLQLDVGTQQIKNWSTRNESYEPVSFNTPFSAPPIVLSRIQSTGEYSVIYSVSSYNWSGKKHKAGYQMLILPRQKNTTASGFEAILETDMHVDGTSTVSSIDWVGAGETLGWLALSGAAQGTWSGLPFEALLTGETITSSTAQVDFSGPFYNRAPYVLGSIATANENQRTGLTVDAINVHSLDLFMDEIGGGAHPAEAASLLMLQGKGNLLDSSGKVIGETGYLRFEDTDRDGAPSVAFVNTYENPVVFVQVVNTNGSLIDSAFRMTDISSTGFSGYLQSESDKENQASGWWETFDLYYYVLEAGSWQIDIHKYQYSITAGNESGAFKIDADTGQIKVADSSQLDYESGVTAYNLTVQVSDGSATGETNVAIALKNVNDSLNAEAQAIHGLHAADLSAWSMAGAGDVNGDGFDDVIVGAPREDTNGEDAGQAYVLFGNAGGVLSSYSEVIAGNGGFVINGAAAGDSAGMAVSGGVDVNGDGLDDVVVGAPYALDEAGTVYVVFGKTDTNPVELADIAADANTGGFAIVGASDHDWEGGSLALGDVNGDGLADISFGEFTLAYDAKVIFYVGDDITTYANTARAYTVFGKTDGSAVALADIIAGTSSAGFAVDSGTKNVKLGLEDLGSTVMPIGDFNGDGLTDYALNAPNVLGSSGKNVIIFGRLGDAVSFSDLSNGSSGITILPESGSYKYRVFGDLGSLTTVLNIAPVFLTAPLGDVNADGMDDLALLLTDSGCCENIDAPRAYIIYGTTSADAIELSEIAAGNGGYALDNTFSNNNFADGQIITGAIAGAGDFNGDGHDDIVIGDPYASNGNGAVFAVRAYLNDLDYFDAAQGDFYSNGNAGDGLGHAVASAGDINGDGIVDMLLAAPQADPSSGSDAGTLYVMLGKGQEIDLWGTAGADSLSPAAGEDHVSAGSGDDTIYLNSANTVYAGPGDDTLIYSGNNFVRIDGGNGTDTLKFDGANLNLNLVSAGLDANSIEIFDISGSGANIIAFNKNISDNPRIIVKGDSDDKVYSTNQQWVDSGTSGTLDGVSYRIYSVGSAQLWVQSGMDVSINAPPTIPAQSFSVNEYSNGGTLIGTVSADANDIGDSVVFTLLSGNEAGYFSLDSDSGELALSDSIKSLDYESGASYALTVEVADQYGATAQGVVTVNVNNLSTFSHDYTMDASGGASIWGSWGSPMNMLGSSFKTSEKNTVDLANIPGLPLDTDLMGLSMEGKLSGEYALQIDGGTVTANLPVTVSVSYPDEVKAGTEVKLETAVTLDEGAGFTADSPYLKVEGTLSLQNYDFAVSTNLPTPISNYMSGFNGRMTGAIASYTKTVETTGTVVSGSPSADNPLRLEARVELPEWVNERLEYPDTWSDTFLSLSGLMESCKENALGTDDLYYKMSYTLMDAYLWAVANLYQDFSVELQPLAVLTLEDGTVYSFDPRESLNFTPQNSQDTDADGIIDASLAVSLNPVFTNDTVLNVLARVPLRGAEVSYNLQEANITTEICYKYGPNGKFYSADDIGPLIDMVLLDAGVGDADNNLDWIDDVVSYSLSSITYTEQLAFDLCDGSGTDCAAAPNHAPSAGTVSIVGSVYEGYSVSGVYSYSDTDGDAETGSSYQWYLADTVNGNGSIAIPGASGTGYSIMTGDSEHYLRFCVIPSDGQASGTQACSEWTWVRPPNVAPVASAVSISGTADEGSSVNGVYSYSDAEGDAESGSSYQWYLASNDNGDGSSAISGANAGSYSIVDSDGGKFLRFCVTPSDGRDSGSQACSDWLIVRGQLDNALVAGFGKSLALDGSNQYARISLSAQVNPATIGSFSAETWFKVDAVGGSWQNILHQHQGNGSKGRVWLGISDTGRVYTWLGGVLNGTTVISAGVWHHAAVVYDQTDSTLKLYLDGELEANEVRTMESGDGDLILGAHKDLAAHFFGGELDETRIWTEARTQAQIQQNMGLSVSPSAETNLLLQYSYDNDSAATLLDSAGHYNGTQYNTAPFISLGMKGSYGGFVSNKSGILKADTSQNADEAYLLAQPTAIHSMSSYPTASSCIQNGDVVTLRTHDGQYWSVVEGVDQVQLASPNAITDAEKFVVGFLSAATGCVETDGDSISLQSVLTGNYLRGLSRVVYQNGTSGGGHYRFGLLIITDESVSASAESARHRNSTERTLNLDGTGDYVDLSDEAGGVSSFDFSSDFSFELWIKVGSFTDNWQAIMTKGDNSWRLSRYKTSNTLHFAISKAGGGYIQANGGTNVNDGQWHHIACVADISHNKLTLYVDGMPDATATFSGTINQSDYAVHIGGNAQRAGREFDGSIDEVRIWNSALSQAQVQANMHQRLSGSEGNLLAYYNFEQGNANDLSGNAHHGTLAGNPSVSYRGIPVFTGGSGAISGTLPKAGGDRVFLDAAPGLGSVSLDSDSGAFSYIPTDAERIEFDLFSYYVIDANGNYSTSETVYLQPEVGGM